MLLLCASHVWRACKENCKVSANSFICSSLFRFSSMTVWWRKTVPNGCSRKCVCLHRWSRNCPSLLAIEANGRSSKCHVWSIHLDNKASQKDTCLYKCIQVCNDANGHFKADPNLTDEPWGSRDWNFSILTIFSIISKKMDPDWKWKNIEKNNPGFNPRNENFLNNYWNGYWKKSNLIEKFAIYFFCINY